MNKTLNPKLFNLEDSQLKPEVRDAMMDIANEFLSQAKVGENKDIDIDILDIRLVGSNAGYNYTKYSDIDIHIVVDIYEICKDNPKVLERLFKSEKLRFNKNYDIEIKGMDAEVYVEDIRVMTSSSGIYSILFDRWIKYPDDTIDSSIPKDLVENQQYIDIRDEVVDVLENGTSDEILDILKELKLIRKESLEAEGESGLGNLIFKQLRNEGLVDALREKYYITRSKELTLEGFRKYTDKNK